MIGLMRTALEIDGASLLAEAVNCICLLTFDSSGIDWLANWYWVSNSLKNKWQTKLNLPQYTKESLKLPLPEFEEVEFGQLVLDD